MKKSWPGKVQHKMVSHRITYRLIYADIDQMGVAYHANYLKWFEMGRTELFRSLGLAYKAIEKEGIALPVSEAYCKYLSSARYDDLIIIETQLDESERAGMKFLYKIYREGEEKPLITGWTRHACVNPQGRVVRPPKFLKDLVRLYQTEVLA